MRSVMGVCLSPKRIGPVGSREKSYAREVANGKRTHTVSATPWRLCAAGALAHARVPEIGAEWRRTADNDAFGHVARGLLKSPERRRGVHSKRARRSRERHRRTLAHRARAPLFP